MSIIERGLHSIYNTSSTIPVISETLALTKLTTGTYIRLGGFLARSERLDQMGKQFMVKAADELQTSRLLSCLVPRRTNEVDLQVNEPVLQMNRGSLQISVYLEE